MQKVKDLAANPEAKAEELKSATDALVQSAMKLGEAIYKASQAGADNSGAANASATNESTSSNEKVVDAEYEEVKDDKRE